MFELLPWMILILLMILSGILHSSEVNKPLAVGITLIVIGGLCYLTAAFSEPAEPDYNAVEVLLVIPALAKLLCYALDEATAEAFGLLALIGVLLVVIGCIQIRKQRKRSAEIRLNAPKIDDAVIRSSMHHGTEDAPDVDTD